MNADTELFYFGCWGPGAGHYLWTRHGKHAQRRDLECIGGRHLDSGFAPHVRTHARGEYCQCPQVEGSAALHHVDGWTVLAFWDRSVDQRYGSNSAFLARGEHTFSDMTALARDVFPAVWQRFGFGAIVLLYDPVVRTQSEIRIAQLEARVRELEAAARQGRHRERPMEGEEESWHL